MRRAHVLLLLFLSTAYYVSAASAHQVSDTARRLEILFLGHTSNHHNSGLLADIFTKEYFKSGINISYTTDPNDLNERNLSQYDGLIVYANYDSITKPQEQALLNFVRKGKGFIPLHCASWCFRNSDTVVDLIGGQFKTHGYDTFSTVILHPEHPVMKGVVPFSTKDETYVHDKLSKSIEVLTERVQGDHHEPYTWVRSYGAGRVFYTAYGHDENTFNNPGFLQLVKNGILWAVGDKANSLLADFPIANPKYYDGPVPNYEKRDPAPRVQEALSPQESMSLMQVPVGFRLQLFASEPEVVNPIFMNWDEKGRLWVIETVDYPNEVKDDDQGDDRIKILEDTDGDGRADKSTIFADKLNIPTSFVFTQGGIIVSEAPSFVFLKDTTGDDKADVRKTLLTGWGKRDTHAQASNLRYGFDNQIWGVVGYSGFEGKVGSDSLKFSQGVYHFTPNGKRFEFLSTTSNNTWGLGFSEDFDVFISTANNTHSGFFGIPKRYLDKIKSAESGVDKIDAHYGMHVATKNLRQVDVHGGFTAAAGHGLYTARSFPRDYWDRIAFVTEPTGRLVHRTALKQEGAGFREDGDDWNMLVSADEWAAPIQAEVGPDGALWITDWYDFIIQHNPTPSVESSGLKAENGTGNAYINQLRDHQRGRIYRLAYTGNDHLNHFSLDRNDVHALVSALSNENMFWRLTAQRLLVEKHDLSVLPDLFRLATNTSTDSIGINAPALHALWTMKGLGVLDGTHPDATRIAIQALKHPAAGVRRAAINVLPDTRAKLNAMVSASVFEDKDLRVRLAALLTLADLPPSQQAAGIVLRMASREENISDRWISQALNIAGKWNAKYLKTVSGKTIGSNAPSLFDAKLVERLLFGERLRVTDLHRTEAHTSDGPNPSIAGKEFVITGDIEMPVMNAASKNTSNAHNGMITTQGNNANGYALYLLDNKLHFQVNQNHKTFRVVSGQEVPEKFHFKAGLKKDGTIALVIDSSHVAMTKAIGLFTSDLPVPLRVGIDDYAGNDRVTAYPDSLFPLRASLLRAKLEVLDNTIPGSESGESKTKADRTIVLKVIKDVMKYDQQVIMAKAGSTVQIIVQNTDFMQHNFVLTRPGSMEKVGTAADKLAQSPDGAKMNYIPKMPEVIRATPLINPGSKFSITIKIPDMAGDYPYICTFPGHWRIMNGILRVAK